VLRLFHAQVDQIVDFLAHGRAKEHGLALAGVYESVSVCTCMYVCVEGERGGCLCGRES
jgi:hypothetical protein